MNDLIPSRSDPETSSHGRTFDLTRAPAIERVPFSALGLYIPGMTSSIQGFDGGINLDALALHHDKGLLCLLNPYLDMAENDFIELFCRDALIPVATHLVTAFEAEKGLQIPLYIPLTRVPDGPANPVFFRLTTPDYNRDETRLFKLNVDTVRPGGLNPAANSTQNENLAKPIFPQPLIDFGVSESDIIYPIPVIIDFYPVQEGPASTHRVARDRIRLSIGGVIVEHRLNEGEAGGQKPVTVMINTGVWQQLPSGSHVCEYEVIDEVGNHSDGWSPPQIIELRLKDWNGPLLPEAYVEESDEHAILDADALDGSDANLVILLNRSDFSQGDILRVKVSGRTANDITVIRFYEYPVTPTDHTARIAWPFADIQPLIGGRAQITYERIRADVANRLSHSVIVGIIGTAAGPHLPAPQVPDAPEQVLPPDIPYLSVNVRPYLGQARNDQIVLVLVGTKANGSYYYRELIEMVGSDDETIPFRLLNGPNGEIAQLESDTLRLYYRVTSVEGTRTSEDIVLDVGEPNAALPAPQLGEAPPPEPVFDPEQSLFDLSVTVKADPDIRLDDTVTVHFEGTALGGSFIPPPVTITSVWDGQDIPFTIPRQYVLANRDRSARIYYTVERRNMRLRFSLAVQMLVGKALDLPVAYILQSDVTGPDTATLNPMQVIAPPTVKIRVAYDDMKISDDIRLYWLGRPGLGTPETTHLPGSGTKRVEFSLPGSAVASNLGNTVKVYYEVSRWDKTKRSGELTLQVMNFDEIPGGNPLPPLRILEAHAGLVDLNDSVTFRVDAWPFFRERDRVWLTLESDNANGSVNRLPIRVASPISSDEFRQDYLQQVLTDVPAYAAWLRAIPLGREIRVVFKVALGGTTEADAVEFPLLKFGAVPQPQWPRSQMDYLSGQNMEGSETLHLPPWAFSAPGQQVWLTLEGHTASGDARDLPIDVGTPITEAEARSGLTRQIARNYFQQLGHDTTLRVTGQISLDGGATRVNLLPLEVTFTTYFLLAANQRDATEYGRFVPDAPGSFAFVMPSAQMGPTQLVWGSAQDLTYLNIPVVDNQEISKTVLIRATRSQGAGPIRAFNNAVAVAGGGSTFMRLHFLTQDNTELPRGRYQGTFRAILKGWNTPSFEQDVWVQVLINK